LDNDSVIAIIGRMMLDETKTDDMLYLIVDLIVLAIMLLFIVFAYHLIYKLIKSKLPNYTAESSLLRNILKFLAFLLMGASVLDLIFGIDATGIIAALGVSSVMVSIGLQDTVANIAAGIMLVMHHIFGIGDTIEIGGYRGVVQDLTWRETTILDFNGDIQSIPNKIFNSTTVNVLNESNKIRHIFEIEVRFDADLEQVAHEICSKADAALDAAGMRAPNMPTKVFFMGSTAYGIVGSIRVYLKEEPMRTPARDCVMRAIEGSPWFAVSMNKYGEGVGTVSGTEIATV
jgi:small-conductance mechanosensitive channel